MTATSRVVLALDDIRLDAFTQVEIVRDLADISGSFRVEAFDPTRTAAALPFVEEYRSGRLAPGQPAEISIDGETVLIGWVDDIRLDLSGDRIGCTIQGRDVTGDLVDCAALPDGPAEYRNLTLTELVAAIAAPFGIGVYAAVDVGARFPRFAIDVGEPAMSAIEKACRQRAILAVSDGVGGLVLTRGGSDPAPAPIRVTDGVVAATATLSWRERFSTTVVKGQTERAAGFRTAAPTITEALTFGGPTPPAPVAVQVVREEAGVLMTGRSDDAEITRYRPRVILARTQSGGASVQEQADWATRIARGRGTQLEYTLPDWRAGRDRRLWRPNEVALVDDPYADQLGEMLVVGVVYEWGERGALTRLRLAGREAFDVLAEGDDRASQRERRRGKAQDGTLDGTARELTR